MAYRLGQGAELIGVAPGRRGVAQGRHVAQVLAQDLPEEDRLLIVASKRPITRGANLAPSGAAAWQTLPSWAVIGTKDLTIPDHTQQMAERAGATITSSARAVSSPRVPGQRAQRAVRRGRRAAEELSLRVEGRTGLYPTPFALYRA